MGNRAFLVAIPKFNRAFSKIQAALHFNLFRGVGWRPNLDANFRCNRTAELVLDDFETLLADPAHVRHLERFKK